MNQAALAERLRILRARRGISVKQASELIGVEWHTLRDLELGRRKAYYPTLNKIAGGYGVPVEELLEEPVLSGKAKAPDEAGPSAEETAAPQRTSYLELLASYASGIVLEMKVHLDAGRVTLAWGTMFLEEMAGLASLLNHLLRGAAGEKEALETVSNTIDKFDEFATKLHDALGVDIPKGWRQDLRVSTTPEVTPEEERERIAAALLAGGALIGTAKSSRAAESPRRRSKGRS
jgi:transcriptional regulator with XRE-family HTH domain